MTFAVCSIFFNHLDIIWIYCSS